MEGLPHKDFSKKKILVMCESEAGAITCFACFHACKALWLKDRFASDVSGSDLSNIMTHRISSRACV